MKAYNAHKEYQKQVLHDDLLELIRENELEAMKDLIEDGADPLYNRHESLEVAIEHHFFDIASYLIKTCKANINIRDGAILKNAVKEQDYKILNFLIENGANLNVSLSGRTALMIACDNDDGKMVDFLINNNADIYTAGTKLIKFICTTAMLEKFHGPFSAKDLIEGIIFLDGKKKYDQVYDEEKDDLVSVINEEFMSYLRDAVNKISVLKLIQSA